MSDVALSRRPLPELLLVGRLASDERLAQLVGRGSTRAFELLYERHRAGLYRYCRSIVRHDEDAKDALQNAMTCALAALRAGQRDVAVRPWLFRIVHNEAISLLRRRRPATTPVDAAAPGLVDVPHAVEESERLATLVADLQSLGERQRAALVMRELSGLSIGEIAAALATSPGAAKQTLFEARCALHELAEGRAMQCDVVRELISVQDGRVLRGRKVRAHLRACDRCRDFRALIATRRCDLHLLFPPLPAGAWLACVGGGGGGGGAAAVGGSATATLSVKAVAGMVAATAATVGAVELPAPVERPATHRDAAAPPRPAQGQPRGAGPPRTNGGTPSSGLPRPAGALRAPARAPRAHLDSSTAPVAADAPAATAVVPAPAEVVPPATARERGQSDDRVPGSGEAKKEPGGGDEHPHGAPGPQATPPGHGGTPPGHAGPKPPAAEEPPASPPHAGPKDGHGPSPDAGPPPGQGKGHGHGA
jgi:RNA polymerase sigma factor (sigma-70 family)